MGTSVTRIGGNLPNGNFLPEVWAKKLNFKYYKALALMQIANTAK